MSHYRCVYLKGGAYFFTIVTERRAPVFRSEAARLHLRFAIRNCRKRWPFQLDALVLLDDHIQMIWQLPEGDSRYSARIGWIKKEFTKAWLLAEGSEQPLGESRLRQGRRGIWQCRFWEHTIRDEFDYARHFDYLHYNTEKHGYVNRVQDWPYSTFHRWARQGVYNLDWGGVIKDLSLIDDLDTTFIE